MSFNPLSFGKTISLPITGGSSTYTLLTANGTDTLQRYVRGIGIAQKKSTTITFIILIDDVETGVETSIDAIGIRTITGNDLIHIAEADVTGTYGFPLRNNQSLKIKITSTDAAHDANVTVLYWEEEV